MDGIMLLKDAFSLFLQELSVGSSRPSYQIYASTLKSCAAISAIKLGKALHSHVVKAGHQSCQFVCKALLNMYAKSKAFDDCRNLFGQISSSHGGGGGGGGDAVTWNIVLSGFAGSSGIHDAEVMSLFHSMHVGEDHPRPNSVTMAIILPVYTRSRALGAGRSIHAYAVKFGLESDILVGNSLISMYAKCGHVFNDAYAMFDKMPERDVVSWNAMIAGFAENKFINEAFELFCWMLKGPTTPNYATVANILPVCSFLEDAAYRFGTEIHGYVLRRAEIVADVSVVNALVSFYLRIGQMREAEALFRRMAFRDLVSWNSVIAGYTSNGEWLKAVELFHEFISVELFRPDCITILSILPACAHHPQVGKQIHGYIIRHPALREDTAVGNALISFYAKCYHTEAAFRTFSLICKRDLISWNSMLNAFAESRFETDFVDHFQGMVMEGIIPDSVTVLTVLQFCATVSRGANVKEAHCFLIKSGLLMGHDGEPILGNALIDAYAKCENMDYALRFFEILSGKRRNVVTCNSIISGYVKCGLHNNALTIFERMSVRDLTTWNLMVRVYAENDCPAQALSLFHELQKNHGMKPDAVTVMSILPVCAQMASVQLLRQCHGYVVRSCFGDDDVCLNGALLDLYSKCGGVTAAYKLFKLTPKKDLVMFTSMIGGFAMHGMGEEALGVFYHMLELGLKPDHVIITAVLSACSHTGLVDKGLEIFESTEKVYGIKPTMEQYACVVDLLARGGRISDAYSFVDEIMPIEANASIWGTLLGACRNHQMVEMGRQVADRLFEIESNNIGNYVVMSNLYAANGRWDGVLEVRKLMKMRDLKKPAGCSWIEVEGSKNVFIAADSSHPQRSSIYSILSTLDQQIKERFQFTVGRLYRFDIIQLP